MYINFTSFSYLSGSIFLMVSAVYAATYVKGFVRHLGLRLICIIDGMSWFARCVMHRRLWFSSSFKYTQDVLRIPPFYPIFSILIEVILVALLVDYSPAHIRTFIHTLVLPKQTFFLF